MSYKKIFHISMLALSICLVTLIILNVNNSLIILNLFLASLIPIGIYLFNFVKFLSTTFFFLMFYLMLFYVTPIVNLLNGEYVYFNSSLVANYAFMAIVGILLFLIGNCLFINDDKYLQFYNEKENVYSLIQVKKSILLLLIGSFIVVFILFIDAGTLNILSLSRIDLKNTGSLLRLISAYGLYIISLLFFLVFFTFKSRTKLKNFTWILFFILFEVLIFLFFRTRSYMVSHTSAALVGYFFSSYTILRNTELTISKVVNMKIKKLFIVISGVGILIFAIVLRFFRGYLQPGNSVDGFDLDINAFISESVKMGDMGYMEVVLTMFELVPYNYDYLDGQSYYRLFFLFIPRFLWADKPHNTETIVGGWIDPEMKGLSIPPGVIGDIYINFSFAGIVLMIVYGIAFALIDKKLTLNNIMFWSISSTWIYHFVRGSFTNPIVIAVILYIISTLLYRNYVKRKNSIGVQRKWHLEK